jgi:hypothetical protein
VDDFLGVETENVEIALVDDLHNWGGQAMPLLNHTPAFAIQLRRGTENFRVAE